MGHLYHVVPNQQELVYMSLYMMNTNRKLPYLLKDKHKDIMRLKEGMQHTSSSSYGEGVICYSVMATIKVPQSMTQNENTLQIITFRKKNKTLTFMKE